LPVVDILSRAVESDTSVEAGESKVPAFSSTELNDQQAIDRLLESFAMPPIVAVGERLILTYTKQFVGDEASMSTNLRR